MPAPFRTLLFLVLLAAATPKMLHAQPAKQSPGDKMIEAYLAAETDKLSKKFLDGATTIQEWQKKRPELHRQYLEMLGLWPERQKTPLHATITGSFEHQGVVIDKLHFQSIPGLYVTANLYRPRGNTKKLPTILYVCGHANKGRDGNKSAYWEHGMWFASNGYNCLMLDSLQLGEIPGVHHGTYGDPLRHLKAYGIDEKQKAEPRWWWVSRGYTPAGVECWNGVRAIDYLQTRKDVDADRIGVTGISGGGAATFWIAAADERVKVAVPVSGMSDLESYVKNKIVNGHCDCMFLYNTYQWDWTTIAALVAPRPLLFANSDADPIFPMNGNRRIIAKLRKIYAMYGKADLVDEYVSKGGHAYRPDLRVAIFKFINKHLKGDGKAVVKDVDFQPIDAKKLRVFPTDDDLPKDALNARIDEVFVPKAQVKLPEKGKFKEWQAGLVKELKEKSFRAFAGKIQIALPSLAAPGEGMIRNFDTEKLNLASLVTIDGLNNKAKKGKRTAFLESFGNGFWDAKKAVSGKELEKIIEKTEQFIGNNYHWALFHRGVSPDFEWTAKSPPNFVERSHVLLGRTVDQGSVYDIISILNRLTADAAELEITPEWRVIGYGRDGVVGAYAALFEPAIKEVIIQNPPKSHTQGPTFLNVLKVLDIPEALGLLAPRKLTLIGANDPAFDRVAEIYKLAGAADKLTRK